jgi:hypothetical protein
MTFRVEISADAERDAETILECFFPNNPGKPAFDGSWKIQGYPNRVSVAVHGNFHCRPDRAECQRLELRPLT